MDCVICQEERYFSWTDTHGVAVCGRCGAPYRLYHYDESDQRVDKEPELCLSESGIEIARRYWSEKRRRVFPACYDMGIMRGGCSYSGATDDDCEAFDTWYSTNYPQSNDVAQEAES